MIRQISRRLMKWRGAHDKVVTPSAAGEKHLPYFELLAALQGAHDACPFCQATAQAVRKRLFFALYENVNDPEFRATFRRSQGLCALHTGLLIDLGDRLGGAILYLDLLDHLDLRDALMKVRTDRKAALLRRCFACECVRETEILLFSSLVKFWDDVEVQAALISSPGLCLSHLLQAAGYVDEERKVSALLDIHRARVQSLQADLREFIRKQDYRFKDELLTQSEKESLSRAMAFLGNRPRDGQQQAESFWHRMRKRLDRSGRHDGAIGNEIPGVGR